MKKGILALSTIMAVAILLVQSPNVCAEEKVSQKKSDANNEISSSGQAEDNAPLTTEVMSKEELQAYLKEKGIPIIKKEDFKEPELVWEKTFNMPIEEISDLTDKGNCIALSSSKFSSPNSKSNKKAILFLDNKGDIRKKMEFKDEEGKIYHRLFLAISGRNAGVYEVHSKKKEGVFTYYDEEGNKLWTKNIKSENMWPGAIVLSYSGDVIVVEKGNPLWNTESEKVGVTLNVNKLSFYDSKGNLLSEYKGFRNMSIGKLSDDGQYFAGIIWWSRGTNSSVNKLVYIRTKDGKVLWEKPFPAYYNIDAGADDDLSISERGSYVAVVTLGIKSRQTEGQIYVFDSSGKIIDRIRYGFVWGIYEKGFVDIGKLADISFYKLLPRYFVPVNKTSELWEDPIANVKENFPTYITKNGKWLKVLNSVTEKIKILRINIVRQK